MQIPPGFRRKPSARDISGRMLLRPTRVHAKIDGFHISAHVPAKNAPDFTLPDKDTPKTRPILGLDLRQGLFRGVCNTPLHGYVQNPPGFRPRPSVQDIWERMLLRPYTGTCKIWRVLGLDRRRRTFGGVCNTPLHGYMQNLTGFIFPHPDTSKTYPVSPFPIRIDPNPARF